MRHYDLPTAVRVVHAHRKISGDDYHEWITFGDTLPCNKDGVRDGRILNEAWQKWQCNNPNCGAFAFVSDEAVKELLAAAETMPNGRSFLGGVS